MSGDAKILVKIFASVPHRSHAPTILVKIVGAQPKLRTETA
ncbi:hypothetical protein SAMN05444413_10447 [Roseivivax marinus]|nr:hypothetical protein SAMN05444413_10447 [Roseivivax marinus]